MRATLRRIATVGCGHNFAMRRFAWAASHSNRAHEPEAYRLVSPDGAERLAHRRRAYRPAAPILLLDQNRTLWDQFQIQRGMQALRRAHELGGAGTSPPPAAIVACHAQARTPGDTDWPRIAGFYEELMALVSSPIIELNRAVAVGMAEGADAALAMWTALCRSWRWRAITCYRAFEATYSSSSAATGRRRLRSKRPRHWRATDANMTC